MNFWIFAIALLVISSVLISWPLITGSVKERITGIWVIVLLPLLGVILYQQIGTPDAISLVVEKPQRSTNEQQPHATQQGEMDELVTSLQQRMSENPNDPDGWVILGRSLKTMQRYAEAQTALNNANRLVPDNPLIMVELAETMLFASGKAQISPQARQLIEAAVAIDPNQQKGLWLLGMAAAQNGDEEQAVALWQRLLGQLDPGSGAAQTVGQQIEMAQERLGHPPAQAVAVAAGFNIPVTITIADDLAGSIPAAAALFVFIHPAGASGMPLAVKRIAPQGFPMSLHFSDADLLRPGMSLQDFEQLDISARISMAGIANAAPGDYQATLATLETKTATAISLHLDQRLP